MPATKVQPALVEAALLALLPGRLRDSYGEKVDVQTISLKDDFDDAGQLVLKSPAIRLAFNDASFGQARDNQRVTLSVEQVWSCFCRHESLRGKGESRTRTLQLVACVEDELAGTRLMLEPGTYTEPILLKGVSQAYDVAGPVDQCYAVTFMVPGIAQFSGVNANFGARL